MIIETLLEGDLVRHYSDSGMMMLQVETGIKYGDAIDVVPCRYTYEETDEPVEGEGTVNTIDYVLDRLNEIADGQAASDEAVVELAELTAANVEEIDSVSQAVVELAEIVGGGE